MVDRRAFAHVDLGDGVHQVGGAVGPVEALHQAQAAPGLGDDQHPGVGRGRRVAAGGHVDQVHGPRGRGAPSHGDHHPGGEPRGVQVGERRRAGDVAQVALDLVGRAGEDLGEAAHGDAVEGLVGQPRHPVDHRDHQVARLRERRQHRRGIAGPRRRREGHRGHLAKRREPEGLVLGPREPGVSPPGLGLLPQPQEPGRTGERGLGVEPLQARLEEAGTTGLRQRRHAAASFSISA